MKIKNNNPLKFLVFTFLVLFFSINNAYSWGFHAHRIINRYAVFSLPPEMLNFYKKNIEFLTERSTDPDKMSRVVPGEAPRHYIDIEYFNQTSLDSIPKFWNQAVERYTEDSLNIFGVLPWHIHTMLHRLTEAFRANDPYQILLLSARFAHYVADANTPLHTTKHYNGRTLEQRGIHAFWETRIPLLLSSNYNYFVGRAKYLEDGQETAWKLVLNSHAQVDTIYYIYEKLFKTMPSDRIYAFDVAGAMATRNFSRDFVINFEQMSNNMVERNLRNSIFYVASFWFTAWVNAGQPDMNRLLDRDFLEQSKKEQKEIEKLWRTGKPVGRPNPEDEM